MDHLGSCLSIQEDARIKKEIKNCITHFSFQLINGVAGVRDAVTVSRGEDMFPPPPPPDMSQLNINGKSKLSITSPFSSSILLSTQ